MKITILGPVNSDKYFGGVAVFTESLAEGFLKLGYDVTICTDYSSTLETKNGVRILSFSQKPLRRNFKLPFILARILKQNQPDILITSLEYSLVLPFIKKLSNTKKIHILHGFPNNSNYKILKLFAMILTDKIIRKYTDFIVANSTFTATINAEIYNLPIDRVINIGANDNFIKTANQSEIVERFQNRIIFVGRLVKAKKIYQIIKAINKINSERNNKFELYILGEGPEKKLLEDLVNITDSNVHFVGKVSNSETIKYYKESDIFISLNPHEPLGIVYFEALICGCKIVCPRVGGQMDILLDYSRNVFFTNPYDIDDIGNCILKANNSKYESYNYKDISDKLSYVNVAKKLVELSIKEKKD